jgi:catalase
MPKNDAISENAFETKLGAGGETHQSVAAKGPHGDDPAHLTTNQGLRISDNQNSLKSGDRGPVLLEDFVLREKIFHFDHERIPERIVHARGSAAHGVFECTDPIPELTRAGLLPKKASRHRFSPAFRPWPGVPAAWIRRGMRGFAVKFYTQEGNWDLVGNNIPVFFIQDAIKFPDLIHAVKMEADKAIRRQQARMTRSGISSA